MDLHRYAAAVRGRGSVRFYVTAVVLVILVPALIIAGWLASLSAASERVLLEQNAEQRAREITAAIDRDIVTARNMLTALASSHFLQTDDLEAFYRQALAVSQQLGIQIVLRDPQLDEQIVNTAAPWGAARLQGLPPERREAEDELLRSNKPVVSNVFFGPVIQQYVVAVLVPVMRNAGAAYVLSVGIPAEQFAGELQTLRLPPAWIVTIIDRKNIMVARSEKHSDRVGKHVTSDVVGRASGWEGVNKGINREGIAFHWAWRRSAATGWFISVGVPESVLNAASNTVLVSNAAGGGLLLAFAIALSYYLGGRISQSVGALGIDRQPTREEFQVLFEFAPNGVLVLGRDGHIALVNARMETMFGYSREELIGMPVETLIPERFRGGHSELRTKFARAPQARPMGAGRDLFGQRKDGSEFPVEIGLNPIRTRAGDLVMATVVDVTARKHAAERLSAAIAERDDLRRRFMQAQEDERLRLAHELHDQTGQSLAAVMLQLKGMDKLVDAAGRNHLRLLRKQLEQMGKALHHVAWELRPASIDELGLASLLANYVSEWSAQFGIDADFHCRDGALDGLTNEMRTTIYRVIQEALTNIARHARGVTSASVVIDRSDATLQLTIEDNGTGFDADSPSEAGARKDGGLGLAGMRERLSLIGGDFVIESSTGGGTTIFARIPVARERLIA